MESTRHPLCPLHHKNLQVYCEKDRKVLCSQCIIYNHQHHKLCTVQNKASKEKNIMAEQMTKVEELLQMYRGYQVQNQTALAGTQHSLIQCQAQTNLLFKTIHEQIDRLQQKQLDRLTLKKQQTIKKITSHHQQLQQQIDFLTQIEQMGKQMADMHDADFLLQEDKRNFIWEATKSKKDRYVPQVLTVKKGQCLQEVARSIQQMINLEQNKNSSSNSVNAYGHSPSLKKKQEPAVLEVNLREEYQKRKGTVPKQPKLAKKTISIAPPQAQKLSDSLGRKHSFSQQQSKDFIRMTPNRNKIDNSFDSSIGDMSNSLTPLSSIQSFMGNSRISHANSLFQDTTLKHTFNQFSMLMGSQQCVYHFGGLSDTCSEKFHGESGRCQRMAGHAQLKGRGYQTVRIKNTRGDKCLILGGMTNKGVSPDIYEFNFKEEKIYKSTLKVNHTKSSFVCIGRDNQLYIIGGKNHEKAQNTVQCYKYQNSQLFISKMPHLTQARFDHSCVSALDGHVYTLGGITLSNDATNTVERYNQDKGAWQLVRNMKNPRINFVTVATPRGLFVLGGHTTKRFLRQVQFYDYQQQKWTEMQPMHQTRCYHTAILSKDYQSITIFGGLSQNNIILDSIQIYHIQRDEWVSHGKMREKRCLHVSVQK